VCVIPDVTAPLGTMDGIGDGTGKVYVTDAVSPDLGGSGAFAWNPNNPDQLAVVRDSSLGGPVGSQVWLVNFDGSGTAPVGTRVVLDATGFPAVIHWMDWSRNGSFIAFEGESPQTGRNIYRIEVATGAVTPLTSFGQDYRPVVSPDNTQILFARDIDGHALFRIPSGGGTETQITPLLNFSIALAGWDWSPDGSEIVHTTDVLADGTFTNDVMIGKVKATTVLAGYAPGDLVIIGRVGTGNAQLQDRLPTWRP
jgi:Tol biopolymer transport system component